MRLDDRERHDRLRLIRSEGVGPRTFRGLVSRFGSAAEALAALPDLARKSGRRVRIASAADAERELTQAQRLGVRLLAPEEEGYPRALGAIDDAPPLLAVRGSVSVLSRPAVAIVGSRNASAAGCAFAERLAAGLRDAGYAVVSGLARGIDVRAHRAAPAQTVAVLAGGHDRVYPDQHVAVLDAIIEAGGAAVSEMPLGWEPRARDFPRRNRLISGLSYGVVVVEAARRSGSLITARFALEQGREVFAVPGSPLDPRAEGTNDLIRQGATLCAATEHVTILLDPLTASGALPSRPQSAFALEESPADATWRDEAFLDDGDFASRRDEPVRETTTEENAASALLALLGPSPVHLDELTRQAALPARQVRTALLELELSGRIDRQPGGLVVRRT